MEIKTYRELESKDELFPLLDQALWERFVPIEFEETIQSDPRLRDSPVGYAITEDDHVNGFVGVMDLVTKTFQGVKMRVGGIWNVATHPSYTRRGIATNLMDKAHECFRKRGYMFSFLTTGRATTAYQLYQKLGYQETLTLPTPTK